MKSIAGSRILITGGAGFIGSHTTDQLLKEGVEEIILIDDFVRGSRENVAEAMKSGKVKLVKGDIRDEALLDDLFEKGGLLLPHGRFQDQPVRSRTQGGI